MRCERDDKYRITIGRCPTSTCKSTKFLINRSSLLHDVVATIDKYVQGRTKRLLPDSENCISIVRHYWQQGNGWAGCIPWLILKIFGHILGTKDKPLCDKETFAYSLEAPKQLQPNHLDQKII